MALSSEEHSPSSLIKWQVSTLVCGANEKVEKEDASAQLDPSPWTGDTHNRGEPFLLSLLWKLPQRSAQRCVS